MPALDRLLQGRGMTAEEVSRLRKAYDMALREIGVEERGDPLTERVAMEILEAGRLGLKDPAEICRLARRRLGL